ncbi:MAG TPA: TlpA disulfide reductase family protein [Solirubrobacteraceae bacterium]|jgi:cytochrome c biogenesis protein CcmG/thiol:disulfide interchange protein DsbE|nr:TlpA disulfide reductase family protein [Solirubrobacteraceae bacterium]
MRRPLRMIASALAAAAVVVALVLGLSSSGAAPRPAPPLPREHLTGAAVTLPALLFAGHGAAAVVFWASWCGPCEHEAPEVERFAQSAGGRGHIVGVDWSDARGGALAFIRHFGWTFPNVRDGDGTVGNAYRLTNLPTTFVIGRNGRIASVLHGPQSEATLTRAVAAAD